MKPMQAESITTMEEANASDALTRARRAMLGLDIAPTARRSAATVTTTPKAVLVRDRAIFGAFCVLTMALTCLQLFAIPFGEDAYVSAMVPIMAITLLVLFYFAPPSINPLRLLLYVALMGVAGISTGFLAPRHSVASAALFAVLYLPFIFSFKTTEANFQRCLRFFCDVMLAMVALEFLQHALQLAFGPASWPNPYKFLPLGILTPEFNYLQPIVWGSRFDKPQAFVFLETSLLSQYIALALAIEVVMFQRIRRIAILTAGIFATFAGTGLLLLAFTLPVLLGKTSLRTMIITGFVLALIAYVAAEAGWLDLVASRITEFQQSGKSANHRFIEPFDRIAQMLSQPGSFFAGIGAGQIEKTNNHQFWPIAKATVEYGILSGVLFYGYFLYAMFDRPASRRLAFTLVIWFTFEGALLTALNPFTCMLLSSFFLIERGRRSGERAPA
jgi:hypothetical protein